MLWDSRLKLSSYIESCGTIKLPMHAIDSNRSKHVDVIPLCKEEHAHKEVCIAYCSKSNDSEVSCLPAGCRYS